MDQKLYPTSAAFQATLRRACDLMDAALPCRVVTIVHKDNSNFQVNDTLLYNHIRDAANVAENDEPPPVLESLAAVRTHIVEKGYPTAWVMLDRPVGAREREWIVFDLDTLEPKAIAGRAITTMFVPEGVTADTAAA